MCKNFLILVLFFTILIPQIFYFSAGTGITLKKKVSSVKITMNEEEAENDNEDEEQAKEQICFDALNLSTFEFLISGLRFFYSNPNNLLGQSWEMISPPPELV
jgi:hypothetical protein